MVLFLQVGNRIRKVHSHPPRTLANLRDLFVSHFSSVADNVPINIQEPESKIFYELENIAEVVPYSLLSLPPSKLYVPVLTLTPVSSNICQRMRRTTNYRASKLRKAWKLFETRYGNGWSSAKRIRYP